MSENTETAAPIPEEPAQGFGEEAGTTRPRFLEREGDAAADYLEILLDITDLDGDIDIDVEGNRAKVSVVEVATGDLQQLVGPKGEVLEAIQVLTRLAAARETGERSRLMLDIGGHREARKAVLVKETGEAMEQVRQSKEPVAMAPMTAFERKVVHDAVASAGMTSESDGVEPQRRVVIRVG